MFDLQCTDKVGRFFFFLFCEVDLGSVGDGSIAGVDMRRA